MGTYVPPETLLLPGTSGTLETPRLSVRPPATTVTPWDFRWRVNGLGTKIIMDASLGAFVLVDAKFTFVTGLWVFEARGATTMTWSDFGRWYGVLFRVVAADVDRYV